MALISIDELKPLPPQPKYAPFALGFRPFFLGAGVFGVLLVALWLLVFSDKLAIALPVPAIQWHAHEMLFGYTSAVIAGFLLTAVQNWTGQKTPSGTPLAMLFALWLAARILPFIPGVPMAVYALVDLALFPALTIAIAKPIIKARQLRNAGFPVMLGLLTVANLLVHMQWLGMASTFAIGQTLAIYIIVMMMVAMGGRVIPSFTDGKLRTRATRWKAIEILAPVTVALTFIAVIIQPVSIVTALIAGVAAIVQTVRVAGWYTSKYWSVPLLWVLHLGYAWIAIGFALTALAALQIVTPSLALHAFTTGAIGTLTLGMMARVSLGHTGRMLEPSKLVEVAFAIIVLAGIARIFLPMLMPYAYTATISISGVLWMAAFAIFAVIYAPMLVNARVDGKPG